MRRACSIAAALLSAIALPCSASAAESIQATVSRVDGAAVEIDVGTADGVQVGQQFQVISKGKVIRIPLTGTVTYQEGTPFAVLKVADVGQHIARCLVVSVEAGHEMAVGLDAVMLGGAPAVSAEVETVTTPVETTTKEPDGPVELTAEKPDTASPDGPSSLGSLELASTNSRTGPKSLQIPTNMSISANPGIATPGQKIKLTLNGIDEKAVGYKIKWNASAGWISAEETASPTVEWIAPRSTGKHEIDIEITFADGKAYQGGGIIEVAGDVVLPDRINIEKIFGYYAYAGEPLRIQDIAFDAENNIHILDPRLRCVFRIERGGKLEDAASRDACASAGVRDVRSIALSGGKYYVLDAVPPYVKVFEPGDKLTMKMGENVRMGDPVDMTIDKRGQTYVVDKSNRCFHIFDARGYYLYPRGRKGKKLGEFLLPVAVAASATGEMYVLDEARRDVQIFDEGYRVTQKIDLRVQPGNELLDVDVAPDGKTFYVLEGPKAAVARYTKDGKLLLYSAQDEARFPDMPRSPARLALDSLGHIYIVPKSREGIFRYTSTGQYAGSFSADKPGKPLGIAVDHQGNFTIIDAVPPYVRLYDREGWHVARFGEPTQTPVAYKQPTRVCMLRRGMRPVTLGDSARGAFDAPVEIPVLNVFNIKGDRLRSVGTRGTGPGEFTQPVDLDADGQDNIYVLDQDLLKVSMYSAKGLGETPERERNFSRGTRLAHEVAYPTALAVDSETEDMYIFDAKVRRIKKFNKDAIYMATLGGDTGLIAVERMKVDHLGFLWVLDRKLQQLRRIDFRDKTGSNSLTFPLRGTVPDAIDFGLDASGRIYVLSSKDLVFLFR